MEYEILFRGKRLDNGKWIEGFYATSGGTFIICDNGLTYGGFVVFEVDPATVGQYTGLTDKNGVKIFNGDIIKHCVMYSKGKVIKREDQIFTVRYSVEQTRFLAYLPNGVFNPTAMQDCEVIGNIHDNLELMEVQS